jgi:16S rRNA (uracil1498-N3)-methyltransferase
VNLVLVDAAELDGDRARIGGRRARHLIDVVGVSPGQRLRAGVIGGGIGEAEVVAIGDAIELRVVVTAPAPAGLPVDLVVAVPRPKVLSRLLEHAAAWAVRRIDLVNAWRVDKSYLGSSRLGDAAIADAIRLGAEQGATTHLPEVAIHPRLMAFLDDVHPTTAPVAARRLIAHARGGVALEAALPAGEVRPVVIAIGPEGGWIDREVDTFVARGFATVALGPAILRVEAAVTAALAQISLLRRLGSGATVAP